MAAKKPWKKPTLKKFVTKQRAVSLKLLRALQDCYCIAELYREDYETGLADGTYDDKEGFDRLEANLAEIEDTINKGKEALGQ